MSSFIAAMLAVLVVSVLEYMLLRVLFSSENTGPSLQNVLFNGVVPVISGLAGFSAVYFYAYLLSWYDKEPTLLFVLLIGLFMLRGRLKQRSAQTSAGVVANIGLHVAGIILGGLIVL